MWGQSGELGETDDCGHSGHSLFQYECVSTNQNGMLLVIAAYITQYVSLLVCVAFIMYLEGELSYCRLHTMSV